MMDDYCQNLDELDARYDNVLGSNKQHLLYLILGLTASLFSFIFLVCCVIGWLNNIETQPTSRSFIPKKHEDYIDRVTKRLLIDIDANLPLANIITQLRDRDHEIEDNRRRCLAFLSGSLPEYKDSPLYAFFRADTSFDVTRMILGFADCMPKYSKYKPTQTDKHSHADDEIKPLIKLRM